MKILSSVACFLFLSLVFWLLIACNRQNVSSSLIQSHTSDPLNRIRELKKVNDQVSHSALQQLDSYPEEISNIIKRGSIIFSMTAADQKPFFFIDEKSGEMMGVDIELAYSIANKFGVRAEFNRDARSFDDVVRNVANNKADVAISKLSRTLKRAQLVHYTRPYIVFRQALLVNRLQLAQVVPESELASFVRNFRGQIGVIAGSSYVGYAQTNFPLAEINQFPSWDLAIDALFQGRVLAVYRDELEILKIQATKKDSGLLTKAVFLTDLQDPIAIAVSAKAPMLRAWLDIFLEEYISLHAEDLTARSLVARYFGE